MVVIAILNGISMFGFKSTHEVCEFELVCDRNYRILVTDQAGVWETKMYSFSPRPLCFLAFRGRARTSVLVECAGR